jgi:hypothetical protein
MTVLTTPAGLQVQSVSTASAGVGNTAVFPLGASPSVTMAVTGTFTATLAFEATIDQQTWFAIGARQLSDDTVVATTTAVGLFAFTNTGLAAVRARCTAFTSGAASVSMGSGVW